MQSQIPIFYSALLLTGVNLLLRMVGTSFQVYISGRIGAAGVGLLQLVMSVVSLALVAAIGGIRTATMYLTAEELGKGKRGNVRWVLSGCFLYSILCSGIVSAALFTLAPTISERWIGNPQIVNALRLMACFLPIICLCGVMSGYFTAANRIGTLAIVEIAEQLCSMAVTLAALTFWAGSSAVKACICVMLGNCVGSCVTLGCLIYLHGKESIEKAAAIPIRARLLQAALPLAGADIVRSGISTTENLMVPKRLSKNPAVADPLAAFGVVSGMVFPVMMFPACILFGLAELLIPELARCNAAGSERRIRYLVRRGLRVTMLYGVFFGGTLYLIGEPICQRLYHNPDAGKLLRFYAPLVPMLYCDAITDAMTKGLGQQKICVRYNILTSAMDVLFLFFLLPKYGMMGYFLSFLVTHLLNFMLSIRRLMRITGEHIPFHLPAFTVSAALAAAWAAAHIPSPPLQIGAFALLLCCLLYLLGIIRKEDVLWLHGLLRRRKTIII